MLIALFGITPERAQQVWYSIPYATEAAVLVAPGKPQGQVGRRARRAQASAYRAAPCRT